MQPPEPSQQSFVREFSNGLNVASLAMFSITTTVQLWSRIPGSTGRWFFGFYFAIGSVIQILFVQLSSGNQEHDRISLQTTLGLSICYLSIHGLRQIYLRSSGVTRHSYDPGTGVLERLYPTLPANYIILISDLTVAIAIGLFMHVAASPHQARWFFYIVLPSLIISEAWSHARRRFVRQRFVDATAGATLYSDTIHTGSDHE